jgi:hypothetical protein
MRYSEALDLMRGGAAVRRPHFAAGAMIFLVPGSEFEVAAERPMGKALPHLVGTTVRYREHVDILRGDGTVSVWQHNLDDVNAGDWERVATDVLSKES